MYRGFNLQLNEKAGIFSDENEYERLKEIGKNHLANQKEDLEKELDTYVADDMIDGTKIQNEWFPIIEAATFISHSGKDDGLANALAGWIYDTFRLKCFIDKNVWGYSKTLLDRMNSKLSNERRNGNDGYIYDYESGNQVSQHVNMMLTVALQKMIDKSEAVIFLNTENAVKIHGENHMEKTYSPWIYSEIVCTKLIRRKQLYVYRRLLYDVNESVQNLAHADISYDVSLTHLISLCEDDLLHWGKEWKQNREKHECGLDALYEVIWTDDFREY